MMKRKFWTNALALIVAISLCFGAFAACDNGKKPNTEPTYYTVTLDLDGGTIAEKDVSKGLRVTEGTTLNLADYIPTKDKNSFNGWKAGETSYARDDKIVINKDITLVAQWVLSDEPDIPDEPDQLAEELKASLAVYLSSEQFETSVLNAKTAQARVPLQYLRYIDGDFYTDNIVSQFRYYLDMIAEICEDGTLKDSLFADSSIAASGWYGISDYLYTWSFIYNQYMQWCEAKGVTDSVYKMMYFDAIADYIGRVDEYQKNSQKYYVFNDKVVSQANLYYEGYNAINNIRTASRRLTADQFEELLGLVSQATGNTDGHKAFLDRYAKDISNIDSMSTTEQNAFKNEVMALWKSCMPVTQVSFGYGITNILPMVAYNLGITGATPYCDSVMLSYYDKDEDGNFIKAGGTPNWVGFSGRPVAASIYRGNEQYSVVYEKTMQGYFPYTDGWNQPLDEMINLDRLYNYYNHDLGTGANVAPEFALLTGMMHGIDMEHYVKEVSMEGEEPGKEYSIISLWRANLNQDEEGKYLIENTTDMAVAIAYCAIAEGVEAPTPLGLYSSDVAVIRFPASVREIAIKNSADKTMFEYGETFSYVGLTVAKIMIDGTRSDLTADEYTVSCEDFNNNVPGKYKVTIALKEDQSKTITYEVTVKAKNPTIETTLEDGKTYTSSKLTFDVFAKDGDGNKIASYVTLNGNTVAVAWDDAEKTSFTFSFTQSENTVMIVAAADGNTVSRTYSVLYEEGPTTFTFSVDAFSIGCGYLVEPTQIVVDDAFVADMTEFFGYPDCDAATFKEEYLNAAHVLLYTLDQCGYAYDYTGTPSSGFYLSIIKGFENSNNIPEEMKAKLEENGFDTDGTPYAGDELGEFDYPYGSGWMYSVNGVFPNVGFADYYIQDGDVMRVQFTLAYGADVGGSMMGGDGYFENVNKERDALTESMAEALALNKGQEKEYLAAFELIQKFGVTKTELLAAQNALKAILA